MARLALILALLLACGCGPPENPYQSRIDALTDMISKNPQSSFLRYQLGRAFLEARFYPQAAEQLKKSIRIKKDYSTAHRDLGIAQFHMRDYKAAEKSLNNAFSLAPEDAETLSGLGGLYIAQGRNEEAINYLKAALRRGESVEMYNNMGAAHFNLNRPKKAEEYWQKALQLDPQNPLTHLNQGAALERAGKVQEAEAKYLQALELDPKFSVPHYNLGALHAKKKQYRKAIDEWNLAASLDPHDPQSHASMGWAFKELGELQNAIQEYEVAIEIDSTNPLFHHALGTLYFEVRQIRPAIESFTQAINLQSDFADSYFDLALVYDTLSNGRKAIQNTIIAEKLYEETDKKEKTETAKKNLAALYKKYRLTPGDFKDLAMPRRQRDS